MYIVNQKIHKSISYIHLAVQKRRSQIVEILLRNEAMIDAVDNEGNTPTHYASDIPTLRVLIHYGADLTLKNIYKETAQMTAKRENRNCVYQFLRLYTVERKTRPFKIYSDRFGGYYKERLRRVMAIDNWDTSEEKLPELGEGQLPPLELSWDVLEEEQSRRKVTNGPEPRPTKYHDIEGLISEMNLQDESIPILKVRHLRRLKASPNPPGFRRIAIERSSPTHWSEESDHEKEIELTERIKKPTFGKESDEGSNNDEFNGDDTIVY
jgi:hypothetical protein